MTVDARVSILSSHIFAFLALLILAFFSWKAKVNFYLLATVTVP